MDIAIVGIRGIPANYGGFETFVENLAPRLVSRGHRVTVYGRSNNINYDKEFYKGVRIRILPTISHKYLDTVFHTFLCTIDSIFRDFDVVLFCNSANGIFTMIPRLLNIPVIVNVDGLEWQREKWNWFGKTYYKFSEWISTLLPNATVTDAISVKRYYLEKFRKDTVYIPYGTSAEKVESKRILDAFQLKPDDYVLYVSRLEPENNAHLVIKAFQQAKTNKKLVIVGDAPYSSDYIRELKATRDKRIIFTGYVFGEGYKELQSQAYFYIQATSVGGTHPALLEGMGYGNCVLANDVPEHREVLAKSGFYFRKNDWRDLREKIQYLLDHPEIVNGFREKAQNRARNVYSWDKIVQDYETLFHQLTKSKFLK